MADNFKAFNLVPTESLASQLLKNLNISAQGSANEYGSNVFGRAGTTIPLSEDSSLGVGLSGSAYKYGDAKDANLTDIDLNYQNGLNEFLVRFEQFSPEQKALFLDYIRRF